MLHTANAKVKGPRIYSKILPYPIYLYLEFTENSIIFQLCDGKHYNDIPKRHRDVFITSCTITLTSMETKQSIYSVEVPIQKVFSDCDRMGPISATILNDGNFTRYLHDEALTIQLLATLTIDGEYSQYSDIGNSCNIVSNCNWMKVGFENANFTDTTIKVQNKNKMLKVHKVVLASASEAFQKMFVDSRNNATELSDVDFEDISDILAYIYTGTAPNIRSRTSKILIAADRYGLRNLVSECVYELQQRFTPSNVAKSLCLAGNLTSYGHKTLKTACIDFIKPNSMSVYQSDSWKALKETHHALALEIGLEMLK